MSTSNFGARMPQGGLQPARRPNVVWLIAEDLTCRYAGPYGDPNARTPNIDRLARDGVVFERAHCTAPVCAPSRCSIVTGRSPAALGTQHMRSGRPLPAGMRLLPEILRAEGYYCTNRGKTDYNTSRPQAAAWDRCGDDAHWRSRPPGRPFFAVFNFAESHESALFQRRPLLTAPGRVRVPDYLPDAPEVRADEAQYFDCVSGADASLGRILEELRDDGLWPETIVFFFSDHGGCLPRSKRFLYDNGTHTPLVVRFPEAFRHLAPAGPGSRISEPTSLLDLAPTVLSLAAAARPPGLEGRAFAGPAREPAASCVHACRGRMDERYDFSSAATDGRFRYIRNFLHHRPAGQHVSYLWFVASTRALEERHRAGTLTALQRRFFEPRPPEELFDCDADPENTNNLAGRADCREVLLHFRAAVRQHALAIRDTGFYPEAALVRDAEGGSPAALAADAERYPLEHLFDLVDRCQLGGAEGERIASAQREPCALVRHWAAVCALQRGEAAWALLDDADASVRVVAAESVLRRTPHAGAWSRLAEALSVESPPELRLAALNALPYLPPGPERIQEAVRLAASERDRRTGREMDDNWASYVGSAARFLLEPRPTADAAASRN